MFYNNSCKYCGSLKALIVKTGKFEFNPFPYHMTCVKLFNVSELLFKIGISIYSDH